jgi:hypothetical protein
MPSNGRATLVAKFLLNPTLSKAGRAAAHNAIRDGLDFAIIADWGFAFNLAVAHKALQKHKVIIDHVFDPKVQATIEEIMPMVDRHLERLEAGSNNMLLDSVILGDRTFEEAINTPADPVQAAATPVLPAPPLPALTVGPSATTSTPQATPAGPGQPANDATAPATLITEQDEENYGTELIGLAKRAAKEALGPALDTLKREILSQLGAIDRTRERLIAPSATGARAATRRNADRRGPGTGQLSGIPAQYLRNSPTNLP